MFVIFRNKAKQVQRLESMTDLELIHHYRQTEDKESLGILYKRYTQLVFGVCMKYLEDADGSKDAVMDIFEKLFDDLLVHDISNFKSWLYSVSRNHCLMIIRKRKVQKIELKDEQTDSHFMESEAELHLKSELNNKEMQLHKIISELKEEQRKCIELVYLQEKSYQYAAEITGYTLKQVKTYVQNGKRNIKIRMESNG